MQTPCPSPGIQRQYPLQSTKGHAETVPLKPGIMPLCVGGRQLDSLPSLLSLAPAAAARQATGRLCVPHPRLRALWPHSHTFLTLRTQQRCGSQSQHASSKAGRTQPGHAGSPRAAFPSIATGAALKKHRASLTSVCHHLPVDKGTSAANMQKGNHVPPRQNPLCF